MTSFYGRPINKFRQIISTYIIRATNEKIQTIFLEFFELFNFNIQLIRDILEGQQIVTTLCSFNDFGSTKSC